MQGPDFQSTDRGLIIVVSGPSGSGKTSICRELLKCPSMVWSISVTTRERRPNERQGIDYCFIKESEFRAKVEQGALVEHAYVFGHWYGTPRQPLEKALREGRLYLMEVDVEGGENVMRAFPRDTLSIFVKPLILEVLGERLRKRGTDGQEQITRRLERAEEEMRHANRYDRVVVNEDLGEAVKQVKKIILETRELKGGKTHHR